MEHARERGYDGQNDVPRLGIWPNKLLHRMHNNYIQEQRKAAPWHEEADKDEQAKEDERMKHYDVFETWWNGLPPETQVLYLEYYTKGWKWVQRKTASDARKLLAWKNRWSE